MAIVLSLDERERRLTTIALVSACAAAAKRHARLLEFLRGICEARALVVEEEGCRVLVDVLQTGGADSEDSAAVGRLLGRLQGQEAQA